MLLAFYGTLMQGFGAAEKAGVAGALRFEGVCRIPGELWDLGPYPGLAEGQGEVAGELYSLSDEAALELLDAFEDEGSLYVRRQVRLIEPEAEAWVYVYNQPLGEAVRIPSGCWRTHVLKGGESQPG